MKLGPVSFDLTIQVQHKPGLPFIPSSNTSHTPFGHIQPIMNLTVCIAIPPAGNKPDSDLVPKNMKNIRNNKKVVH
jgi:hypothetical protein